MSDYYEPTLLFRANAIRRYLSQLSPIASVTSFDSGNTRETSAPSSIGSAKNSTWMLNLDDKDTKIINKICSTDVSIKSNYWKIPDDNFNLTSMCITQSDDNNNSSLAISSANESSNLFIYELDITDNYLTHHNTISLPSIHSMKWVPNSPKHLVTGNNKGYAHLISVPDRNSDESASICKRFNHRKHLKIKNDDKSNFQGSGKISKLNFLDDRLLSLFDGNLFYWDLKDSQSLARPVPISISRIPGIRNFDPCVDSSHKVGICGKFGASLYDLRTTKFNIPSSSFSQPSNLKSLSIKLMKWNPCNENVFAAYHDDGLVRLWDIRKQDSFSKLHGHEDEITSIEWNNGDLFTGGRDGKIVHWDLTSHDSRGINECGLKEGFNSFKFNAKSNRVEDIVNQRQCGTILPASNNTIINMCSLKDNTSDDVKVLSIDGSSFFGLHSKTNTANDIQIKNEESYYSKESLDEIADNNKTIRSSIMTSFSVESIKPLSIKNKSSNNSLVELGAPFPYEKPSIPRSDSIIHNSSQDTLLASTDDLITEDSHKLGIDMSRFNDDEFTFGKPSLSYQNHNDSVVSVDSSVLIDSSPDSSYLMNDSIETLSTMPTVLESPTQQLTYAKGSMQDDITNLELTESLNQLNFNSNMI